MKVFVDTNVVFEMLAGRQQADTIGMIFDWMEDHHTERFLSLGSFYTLAYLIESLLHQQNEVRPGLTDKLRDILNGILAEFSLSVIGTDNLSEGINDAAFSDLEDSFQFQSALASHCDVLLTINIKDFKHADKANIKVMTPQQFQETFLK